MILIVSYPDEDHTLAVMPHLVARRQRFSLLDLASLPAQASLTAQWSMTSPTTFRYSTDSREIDLSEIHVGWWRRVRPHCVSPQLRDSRWQAFAQNETSQAVQGVLDSLDCPWINPRHADESAHRKPYQLTLARQLGISVPETLVTNDPLEAKRFLERLSPRKVVCKAFIALMESWRETRLVTSRDCDQLEDVRYAPVIFQEFIDGVDLRVIVVGERFFTVRIDARQTSYPVDMRMVIGEARTAPVDLPQPVCDQILRLMKALGLTYGAIDMKLTDEGKYVFLEVNPAGQWLFVERLTGLPISEAMADLLAEYNRRVDS